MPALSVFFKSGISQNLSLPIKLLYDNNIIAPINAIISLKLYFYKIYFVPEFEGYINILTIRNKSQFYRLLTLKNCNTIIKQRCFKYCHDIDNGVDEKSK